MLEENEEFNELKTVSENFSVDELETKVKLIYADEMLTKSQFSAKPNVKKQEQNKINLGISEEPNDVYGVYTKKILKGEK